MAKIGLRMKVIGTKTTERKDGGKGSWYIADMRPVEESKLEMKIDAKKGEAFFEKWQAFMTPEDTSAKICIQDAVVDTEWDQLSGMFKNEDGDWYPRDKKQFISAKPVAAKAA